jgi:3-hydroxyisobutyrate dehydrogenase-like beta-hydroxyacid dehydrogenase
MPTDAFPAGFIGLGRMGLPMARRLLGAGFAVHVASRSPGPVQALAAEGAQPASTPAQVAARADIVCTCLPDEPATEAVYFGPSGLLAHARAGQGLVECSTISPALARRIVAAARKRGAWFVDAPVSGGVERAADGTLAIMAGGDPAALRVVRQALEAFGTVHHVGGPGQGCVVKLANQLLVGVHTAGAAEALVLARASGADVSQVLEVLSGAWAASTMLERTGPLVASGEYGSRAPVRLLAKDLALVERAAGDVGISLPLAQRTREVFDRAMAAGLGEMDIAAVATLLAPGR